MNKNASKFKLMYYAKQSSPGNWHVINPEGNPITDNAPYGVDRVLVFRDEDAALERVEMCNDALDLEGVL